jgi:hypothetical protein
VVWNLPLQGGPGGPTSITSTAPHPEFTIFYIATSSAFVAHSRRHRERASSCPGLWGRHVARWLWLLPGPPGSGRYARPAPIRPGRPAPGKESHPAATRWCCRAAPRPGRGCRPSGTPDQGQDALVGDSLTQPIYHGRVRNLIEERPRLTTYRGPCGGVAGPCGGGCIALRQPSSC